MGETWLLFYDFNGLVLVSFCLVTGSPVFSFSGCCFFDRWLLIVFTVKKIEMKPPSLSLSLNKISRSLSLSRVCDKEARFSSSSTKLLRFKKRKHGAVSDLV